MACKPTILHLGDPFLYNPSHAAQLAAEFTIIRPEIEHRHRPAFLSALQSGRWGPFDAILRPFWSTGGEMGRWDHELIPLLPRSCKVFASAGAGYDWADVDLLAAHGILYCNGAAASSEAVADMALWHILSAFRNITWSALAARSLDPDVFREAHRWVPETSHNPRGHVLGIVGLGNIGYRIAEKVDAALGMRGVVLRFGAEEWGGGGAVGATYCASVEELVAGADCVILAVPFKGDAVITAELLAKFKPGSRFVNVARGSLVDENALADALDSGHIFAAGLDVHCNEPHVNPRLAKMRNVSVTCHNAGGALETRTGFERLAMENVQRVLRGQEPLTPVNKHLIKAR